MDDHAEASVELSAITANIGALRAHVAPAAVMAVVKANGYGHGAVPAARAALRGGADWLGVVHVAEALELRRAGLDAPLLCLMSIAEHAHADAITANVDLAAGSAGMVRRLAAAAAAAGRPARVHLKADTGLSRGGAVPADWPSVLAAAREAQDAGRLTVVGVWSHFASADEPGNPSIEAQLAVFKESLAVAEQAGITPRLRHIANTAAALDVPQARYDMVRVGGGIYGLSTLPGGAPPWLRQAMTLRARLALVKRVPAGTGVSYGHRYTTERESTLGLVPLGYADGIPRSATGQPLVFARGRRWPIAGTVCMDQFVVDFGDEPVSEGDEVVIFGPGDDGEPTAQEWADRLGTISYEIVTGIGARVPRSYCDNEVKEDQVIHNGPVLPPVSLTVSTAAEMRELGLRLASVLRAGDLVILSGGLGAGKTTLTKGIGDGLGVRGPITSPTFVIARVHPRASGGPALVHVDAYRLGSALELDDLDLDTDVESAVTVVEWGEGLAEGLSSDRLEITITSATDSAGTADMTDGNGPVGEVNADALDGDMPRTVLISGVGERWEGVNLPLAGLSDRL